MTDVKVRHHKTGKEKVYRFETEKQYEAFYEGLQIGQDGFYLTQAKYVKKGKSLIQDDLQDS